MIVTFGDQPPVFARPKEADIPYPPNCKPLYFLNTHNYSKFF